MVGEPADGEEGCSVDEQDWECGTESPAGSARDQQLPLECGRGSGSLAGAESMDVDEHEAAAMEEHAKQEQEEWLWGIQPGLGDGGKCKPRAQRAKWVHQASPDWSEERMVQHLLGKLDIMAVGHMTQADMGRVLQLDVHPVNGQPTADGWRANYPRTFPQMLSVLADLGNVHVRGTVDYKMCRRCGFPFRYGLCAMQLRCLTCFLALRSRATVEVV